MKFIITNDDGYGETGLLALLRAVSPLGAVTVAAPRHPHSSCGHQVNMKNPLRVEAPEPGHFVVHGSPADCTRLSVKHLAPDADWLIAGINPGANLGSDVYQSGTVAAAREAAILGIRAIAISQYIAPGWSIDWQATERHAARILPLVMQQDHVPGRFWNINLPSPLSVSNTPEHVICPLDKHPHTYRFVKTGDGYQYEGIIHNRKRTPGSDVDVCFSGGISITPMEI